MHFSNFRHIFGTRTKNATIMKIKETKVNLRTRSLDDGRQELFIDYTRNGKRTRQALGLFILPAASRIAKKKNDETRLIAEEKRKYIEDTLNGRIRDDEASGTLFFSYFNQCAARHEGKTRDSWTSALRHLKLYEPDEYITLGDITREWVEGFKDYLENAAVTITDKRKDRRYGRNCRFCRDKTRDNTQRELSQNTAANYFAKVVACLNAARVERLISSNPADGIRRIQVTETERSYLSASELRKLMKTQCEDNEIKRAFVFACMTGLRFNDVRQLTWGNVQEADGYCRLVFRQQKTKGQEYPPLNEVAVSQMGSRQAADRNIFAIGTNKRANDVISRWCKAARIDKHITFHCSRHTFATLLLESDTDIYTASKLLGHRKVQTTQIYAKVVDKKQREAVERLNNLI